MGESLERITVGLGERSYPIVFGGGILDRVGELCREQGLAGSVAVVTNPTVGRLYREPVCAALTSAGFRVEVVEIPDGEEYKSAPTLETIYDRLIDAGLDRSSFLVALGGGVVGDIAGYAAATYLRGVSFVQVPTTLLAQVDSSVGGKTGINHPRGKNLIGAFHQPRLVVADVATLTTLTERQYLSGLAEAVKYGIVLDGELFSAVSTAAEQLLARDGKVLLRLVQRCCALKARVVEQDEREGGLRAVLNYGHTLGHAVETLAGYGEYLHGEAVAIGMAQAARIAAASGHCSAVEAEAIAGLLHRLGLPVTLPPFTAAEYTSVMARDKKVREGGVNFVVNRGIGDHAFVRMTDLPALLKIVGIGG